MANSHMVNGVCIDNTNFRWTPEAWTVFNNISSPPQEICDIFKQYKDLGFMRRSPNIPIPTDARLIKESVAFACAEYLQNHPIECPQAFCDYFMSIKSLTVSFAITSVIGTSTVKNLRDRKYLGELNVLHNSLIAFMDKYVAEILEWWTTPDLAFAILIAPEDQNH